MLVDRGQVDQILLKLALNAANAMPDGGTLSIHTNRACLDESFSLGDREVTPGRYSSIVVTDTGSGIDEGTMGRINESSFTTKENGKGTGRGLKTVHGIVTQAGGHIRVFGEVGLGAAFKIYLPEHGGEVSSRDTALRDDSQATETILIADADDQTRETGRRILTARGYTVLEARDRTDALRIAYTHPGPVHLLLNDMTMPGIRGGDLVESIRRVRPGIALLLMSGYTGPEIESRRARNGSLAFVEKPFTRATLLTVVRQCIESRRARSVA